MTSNEKDKINFIRNNNGESNTDINPHMPQYIIKAPWYLNQSENSLSHQKAQVENMKTPITIYTSKGILNNYVYKYRKGACENCGSMSHISKQCCERPRKRGAKWTNKNFCPDEYINEVPLDYEGKRDRWNGYNPDSHIRLIKEYEKIEEEKQRQKLEKFKHVTDDKEKKKLMKDEDLEEEPSSEDEKVPELFKEVAEKFNQENNDQGQEEETCDKDVIDYLDSIKRDSSTRPRDLEEIPKKILYHMCTSKSLHIGEDYSKYLLNLALTSAYYDGKSRAMREDPQTDSFDLNTFKGENSVRLTGDTLKLIETERFIQEANEKNKDLNLNNIAMPSQAELFFRYTMEKKKQIKSEKLQKAISKYGGEEYLQMPSDIKLAEEIEESPETEDADQAQNSKPAFINNHTTVWGSYYHDELGWGYKCCFSFDRNSFCGGRKENIRKIAEVDKAKFESELLDKEKKKEKDEQLSKLNKLEENQGGAFSEIFDSMNYYENSGKVKDKMLGFKSGR